MLKPIDLDVLARTTDEIFSLDELKKKLAKGKPLRIKYGVDVTAPFLHIGHAVNLWMMRYFQEHGHKVVFLIGDFTTRIGDPTGKSAARKVPLKEEIEQNAQHFIEQVGKVLLTDPAVFEVRRNGDWFDKMSVAEFFPLLSMVTHAKLVQRDMFQKRIREHQEIYMHEMLYPLLQGYDSFMLESDLTIVGSDQLFNELMGRFYQERFGQEPQIVMTTKITPGTDGKEKQSKTLGNYIALADTPRDKFGKVMKIPDALIVQYFEVYTDHPMAEIRDYAKELESGSVNPAVLKKKLAGRVVARYHGDEVATQEANWFEETFSKRKAPEDVPEVLVPAQITVLDLVTQCDKTLSRSDARRLVRQGAVSVAGETIRGEGENDVLTDLGGKTIQIGKRRWFKLQVK
ncbi:MAG: tyrosine--tRNA ligase [Myxococcales bacterium]|nr:tyrosine--tRNA ligase [Myxococcales bacterium]